MLGAIYLTVAEFALAQHHYPIAFGWDEDSDEYLPLAITALDAKQNLFLDKDGCWATGTYVPAYVRCFPFWTVEVTGSDGERQHLVCVDENGLESDGEALFDEDSIPTAELKRVDAFVKDLQAARNLTQRFGRTLRELGLLEHFEAQTYPASASPPTRLRSLYRVREHRLKALPGDTLKTLVSSGELAAIYAHLMSLDNFAALLDRQAHTQR